MGWSHEDNYFLPLRIASVSDYMISSARRNVLMQILMKNDYATTKEKSYYTMNGTRLRVAKDTCNLWTKRIMLQIINQ